MAFVKAERTKTKLKIAITGPSGSGKTFSALLIATGLGKKIAVVDTENGSASLYADRFEFDTLTLQPPYTIQKYNEAMKDAESAGYEVLIIDSISHAWAGEGGLLSKKEALDTRGGNSFSNWAAITKEQEIFKSRLLNINIHLVCTIRSKQDYILETNEKGKQAPRKVGLAPIQREGMEYEFTTVFDMAMDHNAQASKDRTGLFDGQIFQPSKDTGKTFIKWLKGAKEEAPKYASATEVKPAAKPEQPQSVLQTGKLVSEAQLKRLFAISKENNWTHEQVKEFLKEKFQLESTKALNFYKYDRLIDAIQQYSFEEAMFALGADGVA